MEEALQNLIDKTIPGEQSRRLKLFAERLFARLSGELAERMGPQRMLRLAQSALEFFSIRTEPISVRVMGGDDGEGTTIVETMMPDCAFIVDSMLEYFRQLGAPVPIMLHPMFSVTRDDHGRLVSLEQVLSTERRESFIHAELELASTAASAGAIAAELRSRLAEVRLVTGDFEAMTRRALQICEETAAMRELVEVRDLLRWLVQGGFVFLGCRRYRAETLKRGAMLTLEAGSSLGILRDEARSRFAARRQAEQLDPAARKLLFEGPALIIGKTRSPSRVHRIAAMDDITIRRAADGSVAFDRFVGLFTSKAYAEEAEHTPVLRAKLREVLEAEHAVAGSHDFKEIAAAFNSFPKEELFRASVPELRAQLNQIIDLKSETEVRLSLYPDLSRQNVIALVVMPRERFSVEVRVRIQEALARGLGGSTLYYHLALGEGYTARLHFCFAARPPGSAVAARLREEIARVARTWKDRLGDELSARFGRRRGRTLALRWTRAFPPAYQAATEIQRAALDIERLEAMIAGGAPGVELEAAPTGDEQSSRLRIFDLDRAPALSELMPLLQNFGIRVLSEEEHELKPQLGDRNRRASVQAFRIQGQSGEPLGKMPGAALMAEAIAAVRAASAEDDPLNALTLGASLSWREVALVRAYLAAAFQMRLAPARPALRRPLLMHPELARALVDLFVARFDPDREAPPERIEQLRAAYLKRLSAVENIADDRIARSILAMVEATVRTNYFAPLPAPDPYIALKFDSARIPDLPDDPPRYEIHVNSPRMEGCHLRAGKVARGGIRFSDRADDYRTEILGLMKTQTVKNAIIVPVGSKGGFIVKPRAGRAIVHEDVVESYKTLIDAMLDLTDNVVAGRIVHPKRVRVLDDDGPYLVVAADKGTAAFSDLANAIATRRGFWLGDAFASGGEHGYDHKRLAITARGAWESVRRHLREMGRDPERGAPVRMVGIGDMSGDVFGNGLLQSANVKLVAAFDHRHIFIDPDPDPAASYAERERLFAIAASSWADYDPALIGPGGGVYKRGA
ncbi:MAG: NAD-glutamate dehydrogenase domain-containing protein, partial [Candidatus Binataceae bacterium]